MTKNRAATAILFGASLLFATGPLHAVLTFTQLDENTFTVSHRIKGFGSRGKATRLVYTKAASLCLAAGYTHYEVMGHDSQAAQPYRAANATLTVKFFQADAEGRTACEPAADSEYVEDARAKLREQSYRPPEPKDEPSEGVQENPFAESKQPETTCLAGCTLEQIAAMARAGLSDDSIRAACEEQSQPDSSAN